MTKMRTKMNVKAGVLTLLLIVSAVPNLFTQEVPPLVYDVENTGSDCTQPPLPTQEELPIIKPLTDPFSWSDGSGRDTTFENWSCRRAEIKAEIENYEIGPKPERPDTINASYIDDTLRVEIIKNGDTLTLTSAITLPEGAGPFPAIIGIGSGSGSLPSDIFTSRDIVLIPFNFGQVMAHTQSRGNEPINKLYPDLTYMGAYSAWSWGVSRLIDGLELVSGDLPVDLEHLAISGCSFAGKMALFAGAFDERIALTIAQESGGGGAAAWRVSETLEGVETLGSTNSAWFMESMFDFSGPDVSKLPIDHHELMAMVAPRALFVLGNPDFVWLADESGYVSCEAAKLVWDNFGISDRFGFSIVGDHGHCQLPPVQQPEVEAFVDKFLLGDTTVNTNITTHPYDYVIPSFWTDWWGSETPYFPTVDRGDSEEYWFEAECASFGTGWNVKLDSLASNEGYVESKPGLDNGSGAPANPEDLIQIPFTASKDTTFRLYGRIHNTPSPDYGSYWIKMDDESFNAEFRIRTTGWEWLEIGEFDLTAGDHTITVGLRQEGAKLDKICISAFGYPPGEMGESAESTCMPDTTTKEYIPLEEEVDVVDMPGDNYNLVHNYPNPLQHTTTITFEVPHTTFVSLKVYSLVGEVIAELAGKEYPAGRHLVQFDASDLAGGVYYYTMKAGDFAASRKMIIQQ